MGRPTLVVALLLAARPALADEATARAAFKRAEDLRKAGKWADACPLYEASYHDDPQLGVLLHLGDCHQKIGKIATAWSEFTDAAELAHERGDSREASAKAAADALAPRVPKLHIAPPPTLIPGLVVKRDGVDITVLVGTDMAIDAGEHVIVTSAPGFVDATTKVAIAGEGTFAQLALPALDKVAVQPVVVAPPKVHEGILTITSQPGAEIVLDSDKVGTGRYEGKVRSGGHTLRVTAPGMRSYQSEIVVADDEHRTVDVPLDKEPERVVVVAPVPHEDQPSFAAGLSFAPGVKLRRDDPAVLAYRVDLALRIGRRVDLGLYAEYGSISAAGTCGTDLPGAMAASPLDYGSRARLDKCWYVTPGIELAIHVRPKATWDPYIALAPGFRFGFYNYTPYVAGLPQAQRSKLYPAIMANARIGVDYHPAAQLPGWGVGAFAEAEVCAFGDEHDDQVDMSNQGGVTFVSLFGGVRTSLAW